MVNLFASPYILRRKSNARPGPFAYQSNAKKGERERRERERREASDHEIVRIIWTFIYIFFLCPFVIHG